MLKVSNFKQTYKVKPSDINLEDLKRIYLEFIDLNAAARDAESDHYSKLYAPRENETPSEESEREKKLMAELERIGSAAVTVTVNGADGAKITMVPGLDPDAVFNTRDLPRHITKVTFDNFSHLMVMKNKARLMTILLDLDFQDFSISPYRKADLKTENFSVIEVSGTNDHWVLGVLEKLKRSVERSEDHFARILHLTISYELVLWTVGIPGTLIGLHVLSNQAGLFAGWNLGLLGVVYFALGMFLLTIFRTIFNYLRWLFPYLELIEQPKFLQKTQRAIVVAGIVGLVSVGAKEWAHELWKLYFN